MSITAAMVKELRERTGAGMMECKKALVETQGDIEKAIEDMRKAGQAKADKKASRTAAEGIIVVSSSEDQKSVAMVEINSETDFAARDDYFLNFSKQVAQTILELQSDDIEEIVNATMQGAAESVDVERRALISKIGENIQVRRAAFLNTDGAVGSYIHGGRIGVIVEVTGGDSSLARDIAMHVAASNPQVVNREDVSEDVINKEKEIFTAQALDSGKPAEIIEKMIGGKINKFVDEISLVGQSFVKDPNTKVGQMLKEKGATVVKFIRYEVGEGIDKKEDNFVEEVMAQVRDA